MNAHFSPGEVHPADAEWLLSVNITSHLLPIVSAPGLGISPKSQLTAYGKVPSQIDSSGCVAGRSGWQTRITKPAEVRRWVADGRYSIGVRTDLWRAIDVDIDDATECAQVIAKLRARLPATLVRRRRGSPRVAFLVRVESDEALPKVIVKTRGGAVEFLASGRQIVIAGTHPSRAKFFFEKRIEPARLTVAEWQALIEEINAAFGVSTASEPAFSERGQDIAMDDPVLAFLEGKGLVDGFDVRGNAFVACPWHEEHSTEGTRTSTMWLRAGSGGHLAGHFRCLHAHCSGRGRDAYLAAVGYAQDAFVATADASTKTVDLTATGFLRVRKDRVIPSGYENISLALRNGYIGYEFSYDVFTDSELMRPIGASSWQPVTDARETDLMCMLERKRFDAPAAAHMRRALRHVAEQYCTDSLAEWIRGLAWDGASRVSDFAVRYMGCAPGGYATAVSQYVWTCLAARALDPGCQADIAVVLVGEQGAGKSQLVQAIPPRDDWYTEIDVSAPPADRARLVRGKVVIELSELSGFDKRTNEELKKWITQRREEWIPKYQERAAVYPRRCLIIGTTNQDDFLSDHTGERRYAPIRVGTCDVEALRRDRNMLWAEAAALYRLGGLAWRDVEDLAAAEHGSYKRASAAADRLLMWLEANPQAGLKGIAIVDLAEQALGANLTLSPRDFLARVIAATLKSLGWRQDRPRAGGARLRLWYRPGGVGV
jgi:predicted P-loop ATPase